MRRNGPQATSLPVGRVASAAAVREFHDAHANALHGWARRRFLDQREAEELVQDTLVLAWKKREQFDPKRGTERSWLFGILRNEAAGRHRRNMRRLRLVHRDDEIIDLRFDELDGTAELEAMVITEALNALSAEHRRVLVAAHFEGHRIREIAAELDLPEGTVKSRLYYGLRSLRAELEERGILR